MNSVLRLGLFCFSFLVLASIASAACECEAFRLAVSMHIGEDSQTVLPTLPPKTAQIVDPLPHEGVRYGGCSSLLVSGTAPSEACGMRFGFGGYYRVPQCNSHGANKECGDWGGHAVYRHYWKNIYLWGDFDGNWFIGTQVGGYSSIYGYVERQPGVKPEDIKQKTWKAYDIDHWVPSKVEITCLPPDTKSIGIAPTLSPAVLEEASTSGRTRSIGTVCTRLFMDGFASIYSTGLVHSFGFYDLMATKHNQKPVYRHATNSGAAFLFFQNSNSTQRWMISRLLGSNLAHAFVDSDASSPLTIEQDPMFTHRRWVGIIPSLATFVPAKVNFRCIKWGQESPSTPAVNPTEQAIATEQTNANAEVQILVPNRTISTVISALKSNNYSFSKTQAENGQTRIVVPLDSAPEATVLHKLASEVTANDSSSVLLSLQLPPPAGPDRHINSPENGLEFPHVNQLLSNIIPVAHRPCDEDLQSMCTGALDLDAKAQCLSDNAADLSTQCSTLIRQLNSVIQQRNVPAVSKAGPKQHTSSHQNGGFNIGSVAAYAAAGACVLALILFSGHRLSKRTKFVAGSESLDSSHLPAVTKAIIHSPTIEIQNPVAV